MNLENAKKLKTKIRNGEVSVGTWMQISHPSIAEILAQSGYEWIAIDLEHGSFSPGELPDVFRAIELHGSQPFVRLAVGTRKDVKTALDAGATGIIVPMIESAKQLQDIITEMQYPPLGIRGVGFSRANTYGKNFESYYGAINNSLTIVAQIEHINAINNLDEILTVKAVDALMIGPYDLSASMGITGQFDHPDFLKALQTFKEKCLKAKKTMGFHVVKPEIAQLKMKIQEGYKFLPYSIDGTFLHISANVNSELKGLI
ncbi:MAG: 2,4-dihydroxyhept-2-ene-1,7-dioic acid aldolase [Bacteriovorax sp.]|nr:2,4-dihydroxyhept-2-ene-1,7-dioic acid aldolase [Bacteriovorax sp.]